MQEQRALPDSRLWRSWNSCCRIIGYAHYCLDTWLYSFNWKTCFLKETYVESVVQKSVKIWWRPWYQAIIGGYKTWQLSTAPGTHINTVRYYKPHRFVVLWSLINKNGVTINRLEKSENRGIGLKLEILFQTFTIFIFQTILFKFCVQIDPQERNKIWKLCDHDLIER